MLTPDTLAARPDLNFLSAEIAAYARSRAAEVLRAGGTIEEDRLRRNLLSSMPLCFNLFGYLRAQFEDAAAVLRESLGLDIATVTRIEVEEAPPPLEHLGDRTAFDAFVEYRTSKNETGFLGIETKYTEPFSVKEYERKTYAELTARATSGFREGAAARLKSRATNQLWRNTLLALSLRTTGKYAAGHSVVVACDGDAAAAKALKGVRAELLQPDSIVRAVTLEGLVGAFSKRPATKDWALEFRRRYLDLTPVQQA